MVSRRSVLLGPLDSIDVTMSGGIVGLCGGADTTQPMISDRSASRLGQDGSWCSAVRESPHSATCLRFVQTCRTRSVQVSASVTPCS